MISSISSTDAQYVINQPQHRTHGVARGLNQIRTIQWLSHTNKKLSKYMQVTLEICDDIGNLFKM
jgi:hypothetical protein